jgi:endonuclease/exonuclease/phosphatase (EEP) superfamily protein YafD
MDQSRRSSNLRRVASWAGYLLLWFTAISLGAVAVFRTLWQDGNLLLIWLNAFTRCLYLPAYLCAALAAWHRRWWLLAVSSVVVAFHVSLMAPDFLRDRRFEPPTGALASAADTSPPLRIFFANVNGSNDQFESLLSEIADANPDVIVLVEFTWPWHIAFKSAPVMAPYVHGSGMLPSHIGSVNVFSKLPLLAESQEWVAGRALHTVAIPLGSQSLRIMGLHAPRPMGQDSYSKFWGYTLPRLTTPSGPTVIVGDFNASEHSPFLSPEVECVRIAEGEGRGSDHKPLILDVRIRDPQLVPHRSARKPL